MSIRARAAELGVDISAAQIVSPLDDSLVQRFAEEYAVVRSHKGVTVEDARDIVSDVSYFGTMMVHLGLADGMVSGAAHTTAHTFKPSFEIIKTAPGVSVVSSLFLMYFPATAWATKQIRMIGSVGRECQHQVFRHLTLPNELGERLGSISRIESSQPNGSLPGSSTKPAVHDTILHYPLSAVAVVITELS